MSTATQPSSEVVEKIRNLLAKTEAAGCTPAEAEAAFKRASRMMAEHNLAMGDVDSKGDDEIVFTEGDAAELARWSAEHNYAWRIVEDFFFVKGYLLTRFINGKRRKVMRLFGRSDNVEVATFTYKALQDAFDRLFREYRYRSGCPAGDRAMFVAGVYDGFSKKLMDERRMLEIERDAEMRGSVAKTAIMLADINALTEAKYLEAHPSNKYSDVSFSLGRGSQSTLDAGIAAGRSLSLNRAIGGGQQKRIQ